MNKRFILRLKQPLIQVQTIVINTYEKMMFLLLPRDARAGRICSSITFYLFFIGSRCIVIAVGCYRTGIVKESVRVYNGDKKLANVYDYHSEMNSDTQLKYCKQVFKVIAGTPQKKSVYCCDRATYHTFATDESKYPAVSGEKRMKREELLKWMEKRQLNHPNTNQKTTCAMLHEFIRQNWQQKSEIVELGKEHNIIVLFLPTAHHILNPIEDIWGHVKVDVSNHNKGHSLANVEARIKDKLTTATIKEWRKIEDTKTKPFEKLFYEAAKHNITAKEAEEILEKNTARNQDEGLADGE
jgi:transposase